MDRASALIFPGGKVLAGWWRQLQAHQPHAFWVGYGFLHRIEAPVNVLQVQPVEPFTHLVLQAFALEQIESVGVAELQARLRLPAAVMQNVLAGMEHDGFLARPTPGRWQTTALGKHALQHRHFNLPVQERRVFPFLEFLDPSGQRLGPPRFLPIAECVGSPWSVDEGARFDIASLQACIDQTPEWKQSFAFPADVQSIVNASSEAWKQVIVDRPERVLLVLILANRGGQSELLGFAVKVDGWVLHDQTPVLRLPASACADWPDLAQAQPEALQETWRSWCRQRQLPMNEVEICALTYHAPRLEVQPPPRLLQRLQAAKSDLFKGDTWLLTGDGYVRAAAQLVIRQSS